MEEKPVRVVNKSLIISGCGTIHGLLLSVSGPGVALTKVGKNPKVDDVYKTPKKSDIETTLTTGPDVYV